MAGLFLSVVSVLPQLWHINKTGGVIQACTGEAELGSQVRPFPLCRRRREVVLPWMCRRWVLW